jgi:predicted Rossmann fold flavoprotein
MLDVVVIGGGAAGFFAAINTRQKHPRKKIAIFEKSKTVLGKVKVSGGGRCNVTHACFVPEDLVRYYPRGKRELLSVFKKFNPAHTIEWFRDRGIPLKKEADGRMFPVTDDSQTIIDCFLEQCSQLGIQVHTSCGIQSITAKAGGYELQTEKGIISAKTLIISSGSSEHFWNILQQLGHTIIKPVPSLFTFNIKHPLLTDLMGLSTEASVTLTIGKDQLKTFGLRQEDITQTGPLLVTHWGLSGPAVLKLSSVAARVLHELNYRFDIRVSFSLRNTEETFQVIQSFKASNSKKLVLNTPLFNLPSRLWLRLSELIFDRQNLNWSDISKKEMTLLAEHLSGFKLSVNGKSTFKEEFVTAGGIDLREVDFKTMESKLLPGIYLAGEVLDIDALTGGFNFQAAWSEAWVISESIA